MSSSLLPTQLSSPLSLLLLLLLFTAPVLTTQSKPQTETRGVPSDIPYIQCEVCKHIVEAAVNETNKLPQAQLTAVQLFDVVETLCEPSSPSGHWTKTIDMVERMRKLYLVPQPLEQACAQECRTLALACQRVMDGVESELAERLYALRKKGEVRAGDVENWFCDKGGLSDACRIRAPFFPKERPTGPPFIGLDPKKVEMDEMLQKIKMQNQGMNVDMMGAGDMPKMGDNDDDDDDDGDNDGEGGAESFPANDADVGDAAGDAVGDVGEENQDEL